MKYNLKMLPEVQENGANSTKNNSSIIAGNCYSDVFRSVEKHYRGFRRGQANSSLYGNEAVSVRHAGA